MKSGNFGYQIPEDRDKGKQFFPVLASFITRMIDHSHDNTDSKKLTPSAITKVTQTVTAAGWTAVSGKPGHYEQTVTVPAGAGYDADVVQFKIDSAIVNINTERVSASSFKIFCTDNTKDVEVKYG